MIGATRLRARLLGRVESAELEAGERRSQFSRRETLSERRSQPSQGRDGESSSEGERRSQRDALSPLKEGTARAAQLARDALRERRSQPSHGNAPVFLRQRPTVAHRRHSTPGRGPALLTARAGRDLMCERPAASRHARMQGRLPVPKQARLPEVVCAEPPARKGRPTRMQVRDF